MNNLEMFKMKQQIERLKKHIDYMYALIFIIILMIWPTASYLLNHGIFR
jgi:accessory gene regulator protein AgrB